MTTDHTKRRRGSRPGVVPSTLAAILVALLTIAGCSIGTDDTPRDLAVSTSTTAAPSTPTVGGASAVLYFVHDGQLVPMSRSLRDRQLPTVIRALLKAPSSDQQSRNLTSSIPVGTRLLSSHREGNTLTMDLSSEFDNVVGPSRQQAIAQMVMTATEFPEVDRLRFSVDGKPVQVATPTRGDTSSVTDCDYRSLLAKPSDLDGAALGQATLQRLQLRQANLNQSCPPSS